MTGGSARAAHRTRKGSLCRRRRQPWLANRGVTAQQSIAVEGETKECRGWRDTGAGVEVPGLVLAVRGPGRAFLCDAAGVVCRSGSQGWHVRLPYPCYVPQRASSCHRRLHILSLSTPTSAPYRSPRQVGSPAPPTPTVNPVLCRATL
jgi:hypothetical protein